MFDSPLDPFFGPLRPQIQRSSRSTYYTSSYSNEVTPYSSCEDMRALTLAPPLGLRTSRARPSSPLPLTDLPSRVNALSRRGATLSTYLAHLAAVMEPLAQKKVDDMGERELGDILEEGRGLAEAIVRFGEQFDEVRGLMEGLVVEKREVVGRLRGGKERERRGKGWKDDF